MDKYFCIRSAPPRDRLSKEAKLAIAVQTVANAEAKEDAIRI